jgi:hypothetical protein
VAPFQIPEQYEQHVRIVSWAPDQIGQVCPICPKFAAFPRLRHIFATFEIHFGHVWWGPNMSMLP